MLAGNTESFYRKDDKVHLIFTATLSFVCLFGVLDIFLVGAQKKVSLVLIL